jgi:hypothetical protein
MSYDVDAWSQYAPITGRQVATPLPCPPWCVLEPGHPFETTDESSNPLSLAPDPAHPEEATAPRPPLFRVHRRRYGDKLTHVAVETYERTDTAIGPTDLGADPASTLVRVQLPHGHGHLTPDGARRLARLLEEAAATAEAYRTPATGTEGTRA